MRFLTFGSMCLTLISLAAYGQKTGPADKTVTRIIVDGKGTGRIFEGVGGLSAGATSRFLIDYPEPYRSQILDYLFKPNYGAGLQHLKVEIGSDNWGGWGSEPSHMRTRDDLNFQRGYEWWLMVEARKRNPHVFLDILPWGVPGWIGDHHFFSQDMIDYDLKFINGAHDVYGLDINYVGIWNETRYSRDWIKELKKAVVANNATHGLHTLVVAADRFDWQLATEMNADPELMKAVDVIGVHYPEGYVSTPEAQNLLRDGKYVPLWNSEDAYLVHPKPQALEMAKMLNRSYIAGKMTKLTHCTTVTGFPTFIGDREGFLETASPWSGHYDVLPSLWGTAHTTQFAQPGWQYIDDATGYLHDANGKEVGTYVTLRAPNSNDYSIIIETADASVELPFSFEVTNGLSKGPIHVWHSDIKAGTYFEKEADLPAANAHGLTLKAASIYSLTTTTGQQKGNAGTPPPDSIFPFPFSNDFENEPLTRAPKYFVDVEGGFETANCVGRSGKCMEQMVNHPPIPWQGAGSGLNIRFPFTYLGDEDAAKAWKDYDVSADVMLDEIGTVTMWGHLDHLVLCSPAVKDPWAACWPYLKTPDGYSLTVDSDGWWILHSSYDNGNHREEIKEGYVKGWEPKTWHHLKMSFRQPALSVVIDGKTVISDYIDSEKRHPYGMVAFGTEWNKAQFDNFCMGPNCP